MKTYVNIPFPTIAHRNNRYELTKVNTISAEKYKEYTDLIESGESPETLTELYYFHRLRDKPLPIKVTADTLMKVTSAMIANLVPFKHKDIWFETSYLYKSIDTLKNEILSSSGIFSIDDETLIKTKDIAKNYFASKDGKTVDSKSLALLTMILHNLDKNPEVHIYQGNPGTGKSYAVNKDIHSNGYSHVLVTSLANIVGLRFKSKDPFIYTHYSFAKLKYTKLAKLKDMQFDCVVVEEASMVSSSEFLAIYKLTALGVPIYFMGDTNQLPGFTGFGNLFNTLLDRYASKSITLDTNHRMYNYEDLLTLMNTVKETGSLPKLSLEQSDEAIEAWLDHCKNGDDTIAVTYRLKDVVWLNNLVLKEVLNFKSSYTADSNGKNLNMNDWESVLTEAALKHVTLPVISKSQIFDNSTKQYLFYNGEQAFARFEDGQWILEYADTSVRGSNSSITIPFKTIVFNFKLGYAMTIHCAQGSEWDFVLYYEPKINRFMDYPLNLRFVGITRAKRQTLLAAEAPSSTPKLRFYTFNILRTYNA